MDEAQGAEDIAALRRELERTRREKDSLSKALALKLTPNAKQPDEAPPAHEDGNSLIWQDTGEADDELEESPGDLWQALAELTGDYEDAIQDAKQRVEETEALQEVLQEEAEEEMMQEADELQEEEEGVMQEAEVLQEEEEENVMQEEQGTFSWLREQEEAEPEGDEDAFYMDGEPDESAVGGTVEIEESNGRPIDLDRRFAWVCCLFGTHPGYCMEVLVLGFSLIEHKTVHPLILMHTPEVPREWLAMLEGIGWELRPVDYLHGDGLYDSRSQGGRFEGVFTKLHVFQLTEFEKVVMLDADLLVRRNVDDLFRRTAPAALKRHAGGDEIDGLHIPGEHFINREERKLRSGINAGVMLLKPSQKDYQTMLGHLGGKAPRECRDSGMPEQDYLSWFYADRWGALGVQYNFQPHQLAFTIREGLELCSRLKMDYSEDVCIVHFSALPKPRDLLFDTLWRRNAEEFLKTPGSSPKEFELLIRHRYCQDVLFENYKKGMFSKGKGKGKTARGFHSSQVIEAKLMEATYASASEWWASWDKLCSKYSKLEGMLAEAVEQHGTDKKAEKKNIKNSIGAAEPVNRGCQEPAKSLAASRSRSRSPRAVTRPQRPVPTCAPSLASAENRRPLQQEASIHGAQVQRHQPPAAAMQMPIAKPSGVRLRVAPRGSVGKIPALAAPLAAAQAPASNVQCWVLPTTKPLQVPRAVPESPHAVAPHLPHYQAGFKDDAKAELSKDPVGATPESKSVRNSTSKALPAQKTHGLAKATGPAIWKATAVAVRKPIPGAPVAGS